MKKIMLLFALFPILLASSCQSSNDDNTSIKLACPRLTQTVKDNVVTVKWIPIPKAEGYAYKLDEGEYVTVDAEVSSVSIKVENGIHTFSIYSLGNGAHTTDSALRTLEFEMNYDSSLPTPEPSASTVDGLTTISWVAVPKAKGYAYKVDDDVKFTEVGADVLSYSGKMTDGSHTFTIYAVGDGLESKNSPEKVLKFDVLDTSVGVFVKKKTGAIVKFDDDGTNIYSAIIDCAKQDSFVILIDNVEYGFLSYGGNGGVGSVNNLFAAVPFYNDYTYYVRESVGRLTSVKDEGQDTLNELYTNLDADGKLFVKIDRTNTDGKHRYYLKLEKESDPSIVLEQHFDLMIFGGEWSAANKLGKGTSFTSTAETSNDGTDAGTPNGASYTDFGVALISSSEAEAAYIANRDLVGWGVKYIYEYPGCIRLCNTAPASAMGKLTTPALSTLSGSANLTVEFDGLRFASTGSIGVKVLNAGRIVSVKIHADGASAETAIAVGADNVSFNITSGHGSNFANGDLKKWSNFSFVVEGATAQTQICWDATPAGSGKDGRYMLDNIVIKK